MRITSFFRFVFFALFLLSVSRATSAQIGIYVGFGPPAIPIYEQPFCPDEGYIWIPGYWAWDGDEYYWVPGYWALPPLVGYLWTPGYWEWSVFGFYFHHGYWGPHVGWYGGINYGFGYFGHGYDGGRWDGRRFFYNRAVNHLDFDRIHNVYENREFHDQRNRVSYNGGNGGISDRPTSDELAFSRERHYGPTSAQRQHLDAARGNRDLRASVNHGRPPIAATPRPGQFDHPMPSGEAGGRWEPPANRGANSTHPTIHPNDLPPQERSNPPYTGTTKLDDKHQRQQDKLYDNQVRDRQKLQQRQEKDDRNLSRKNADASRTQQMDQRHQQQTQQLQQRHEKQTQQMDQNQQPRQQPNQQQRQQSKH